MNSRAGQLLNRLRRALLYAALTVEIAVVIIDKSDLHNGYEGLIFRVTFAMALLAVLLTAHTRAEWLLLAAGCAFCIVCRHFTGRNELLRMFIFAAACTGEEPKRLLKTAFFETAAGCALILLLSVTGIYGNPVLMSAYRAEDGETLRYCLGFGHPNALHCMFFMLVLLIIAIWGERLRFFEWILLLAADAGLYFLTDSRTGFAIAAVSIAAGWLFAGPLREKRWIYPAGAGVMLACVGFSVWAAKYSYAFGFRQNAKLSAVVLFFDRFLNNRIADLYWVSEGERADITAWSLFSSRAATRYFDMGWCRLFYWYGIIPALLVVCLLLLFIRECAKRREAMYLLMLVSMSVYTVAEAHLVSVYIGRNYLLLLCGAMGSAMLFADRGSRYGLAGPAGGKNE